MADQKMFTIDKFLGLNQAGDGDTELKMGEASKMVNFTVTDAFNIATRPGVSYERLLPDQPAVLLDAWAGQIGDRERLIAVTLEAGVDVIRLYKLADTGHLQEIASRTQALNIQSAGENTMIIPFGDSVYIFSRAGGIAVVSPADTVEAASPYVPLVIAGAAPAGGGTELEKINLLSPHRRMDFSADGTSTAYLLPDEAASVVSVAVDNVVLESPGTFDPASHTFTFAKAPVKGVGNVEITYSVSEAEASRAAEQIRRCTLWETFNGSTDSRLFLAGDGSNRCYYSGTTQSGEASALYFPAGNEIAVDLSGSTVTALRRHYSRLLVFKQDGTFAITYEPVTLTDGSTTAGFYLRPVNREFGNDAPGQVCTVNNYPRSFSHGGLYEWRITSSYYRDERYAVRISDSVRTAMDGADTSKLFAYDDGANKTFYIFLNDSLGTVLVHRYALGREGVWCLYRGQAFRNIRRGFHFAGSFYFCGLRDTLHPNQFLSFEEGRMGDNWGSGTEPVTALWESGFMAFGADFLKKYASQIYVSVLPQANSCLYITVETDRKSEYTQKAIQKNLFSFSSLRFSSLTFKTLQSPTISRVRMKVKKFIYYKLKFRVTDPGTRATVLGCDLEIRYGAKAK